MRTSKPSDMTARERDEFADLVRSGGEVSAHGLAGRVNQAVALITLREDELLIGTAAIKAPPDHYRQGHFTNAGVPQRTEDYPMELGWIVVDEQHRHKGHAHALVAAALAAAEGHGVYATTKSASIKHILPNHGFVAQGTPYASELDPDARLTLFVRPP